jgi:hypothetical protein
VVGALNKHGTLAGFDDRSPRRTSLRARRLFVSVRWGGGFEFRD